MKDQIILYNGPNSPFGRKTKITSLVQEIILEEKIINVYEADFLDKHNPIRKIPTLLVNGKAMGAINRLPKQGDFRSNLALGGTAQATKLSKHEKEICEQLGSSLKREGLFFVGIDVIGGMLSEINVTSPTGIREAERLMNIPLADQVIQCLLNDLC